MRFDRQPMIDGHRLIPFWRKAVLSLVSENVSDCKLFQPAVEGQPDGITTWLVEGHYSLEASLSSPFNPQLMPSWGCASRKHEAFDKRPPPDRNPVENNIQEAVADEKCARE
jgi:hypothetical protein